MIGYFLKKPVKNLKINFIIERFFIVASFSILMATLLIGLYFNKYDVHEKQKINIQKTHNMLSHLIVPSLIISDLSEVRRLLYMASGNEETFVIVDNNKTVIMPDYAKSAVAKYVSNFYNSTEDCKNTKISYTDIEGSRYLVTCSLLINNNPVSEIKQIGLLFSFTNYKWFSFSPLIFCFFAILFGLLFFLIMLFRRMLYSQLLKPLLMLRDRIIEKSTTHELSDPYINEIINSSVELVEIKQAFEKLLLNLKNEYDSRAKTEKMKALFDLAAGVAHDITSPLAVLNIVTSDLTELPEDKRILIRSAVSRIKDIANNILVRNRAVFKNDSNIHNSKNEFNEPRSLQLLSSIIEDIVSEKRIQFGDKPNIIIMYNINLDSYNLFADIQPIEFKRALSNLLNNSVDVLGDAGKIELTLALVNQNIEIRVIDNGRGIPPELLKKLGQRGETYDKVGGNGLGVFHARTTCEANDGMLCIESEVGKGTSVIITFQKSNPPEWFVSDLKLLAKSSIVILDDDFSIKTIWQQRLEQIRAKDHQIEINYFSTLSELEAKVATFDKSKRVYYFLDYEIVGDKRTGLDVAEKLKIGSNSILVSSHWNESSIQARCVKLGIRLIPKGLVGFVPMTVQPVLQQFDGVLLDDDLLITSLWSSTAQKNNKKFISFCEPDSFLAALDDIDRSSPVFIDSNLGNGVKGQDLVGKVKNLNFNKIYLATGYEPEQFTAIPGLTGIVGKAPPKELVEII